MYLYYRKLILTFIFELLNRDPIVFDKSEIKKEQESGSEQINYVKNNWFSDRRDKNGCILHAYRTCLVDAFENYEDAKGKSISFQFDARKDYEVIQRESVSKTHYNLGNQDNVHTGLLEWAFTDGSSIHELTSFTSKS